MFTIEEISSALSRYSPGGRNASIPNERAAVGIILSGPADGLNLCMIRRATFETDVWSGHVAMPGGRAKVGEIEAETVIERETLEEVGLQLSPFHRKGRLPDLEIRLAGRERILMLSAAVYFPGERLLPLQPGTEVTEAFWMPVSRLWDVRNAASLTLADRPDHMIYPSICVDNHVVWGVTLRVLILFSDVIGYPLAHFEEIPGLRR